MKPLKCYKLINDCLCIKFSIIKYIFNEGNTRILKLSNNVSVKKNTTKSSFTLHIICALQAIVITQTIQMLFIV